MRGSSVLIFVALGTGCTPGVAPAGVDGGMVVGADGSPCDLDDDCTSSSCTDGTCS